MSEPNEIRLMGVSVSAGLAIGIPFFLSLTDEEPVPEFPIDVGEIDREISRYRKAIFSSREDLQKLQTDLKSQGSTEAITIIDTHLQMLEDPMITTHVEERIRLMQRNTEAVFRSVIKDFEEQFSQTSDAFFQERFVDVIDVSKRILNHLTRRPPKSLAGVSPCSIFFVEELIPSYIAGLPPTSVNAFVTHLGGGNSHAALIARAKGIPYVSNIDIVYVQSVAPKCVIVDGNLGCVILDPVRKTLDHYLDEMEKIRNNRACLKAERELRAETRDGRAVRVLANISNLNEVEEMHESGAQGIGLFRSEYLFMQDSSFFMDEDEQQRVYRELALRAQDLPVVIRAVDLGGDKNPELLPTKESLLGYRGIRFLLHHREIFKVQLKALLRAAVYGDVRLLLPFVSDLGELRQTKALIKEVSAELHKQRKAFKVDIPIGCMIEVPSACALSDLLAEESDFLSIGTNDLAQYTMGIDRSDPLTSDTDIMAHPSVIRLIKMAVDAAKLKQTPISICGEIASNPHFIPLLLGLGVEEFSCAPRYVPLIKKAICSTSVVEAQALASQVLTLKSSAEISEILQIER